MTSRRKQPATPKQTPPEVQAETISLADSQRLTPEITIVDNPFDNFDSEDPQNEPVIPKNVLVEAPLQGLDEPVVHADDDSSVADNEPTPVDVQPAMVEMDLGDDTPVAVDLAPPPVKRELPDTIESLLLTKYKMQPESYPSAVKIVISGMQSYLVVMEDGVPVTPAEGATQQRNLNNLFMEALSAPGNAINMCMDVILYNMNKHALSAFTPRLAYRFLTLARMSSTQVICFQNLIHLFTNTADPKARRMALRSIDLNKVLSYLPNEQTRQNLITYYNNAMA